MKSTNFSLLRYDADEGKVFDWKEPRFNEHPDGTKEQQFLRVKTLFLGANDSIENYVEVDEAGNITELTTPEFATEADYQEALAELGVN